MTKEARTYQAFCGVRCGELSGNHSLSILFRTFHKGCNEKADGCRQKCGRLAQLDQLQAIFGIFAVISAVKSRVSIAAP